jgi:CRISPR-associated protein Cas6
MKIDVRFPVDGKTLPLEHGYPLYAALSRMVPAFHDPQADLRFGPITGEKGPRGLLLLNHFSRLRVRLEAEKIALVLPLASQVLDVAESRIRLGVPTVLPLLALPLVAARIVTFKNSVTPEAFLAHAREQLDAMGVKGELGIPLIREGERAGQPKRRVLRIKSRSIVGYALQVNGLTAEESIRLQEEGLGGRRRMGCGFFISGQGRS